MKKPSVQRIKKEKRDRPLEPAGMNRRRFLTYLGTGSAALAAASSGILAGCAETEDKENPTSTWPDGDIPRPAVVAITGFA